MLSCFCILLCVLHSVVALYHLARMFFDRLCMQLWFIVDRVDQTVADVDWNDASLNQGRFWEFSFG